MNDVRVHNEGEVVGGELLGKEIDRARKVCDIISMQVKKIVLRQRIIARPLDYS